MKQEIDQNAGFQTGPRIKKFLEYKGEKIAVFSKKTGIDRSLITRSFNQIRDGLKIRIQLSKSQNS